MKTPSKLFLRLPTEFPKSRLIAAAQLNAGFSLYQMGQYSRAIEQFDQAAADKKQTLVAGYWRGLSFKALGDTAGAAQDLKATYEADPQSPVAENALFYWADCEFRPLTTRRPRGCFSSWRGNGPRETSPTTACILPARPRSLPARSTRPRHSSAGSRANMRKVRWPSTRRFSRRGCSTHEPSPSRNSPPPTGTKMVRVPTSFAARQSRISRRSPPPAAFLAQ